MKKLRLATSVVIAIISFSAFFYNTLWFWFSNPELTQMQVFMQKWPWIFLVIAAYVLVVWILPDKTS